jgi:hypothetical protein
MITRDNYQEFLLLYLDNELSAEDRGMVEEWVAANPDRQEEWESLLQCRIFPEEETVFRDKKILMRNAGDKVIEERNYADCFFTPDTTIVFPDKNSLYKNEKHRRVVVLYRLLAGAAAVLLAVVTLLLLYRHPAGEPTLVKNTRAIPALTNKTQTNKKEPLPVTPATAAALYPKKPTRPSPIHPSPVHLSPIHREEESLATAGGGQTSRASVERMESGKQEVNTSDIVTIVPERDPAGGVKANGSSLAVGASQAAGSSPALGSSPAAKPVNIPRELSSFATQALSQEDNEKTIATASEPASPGKSKLRGLFRKVTRNFGKAADRDGEGKREVLINAFQVAVN